MKSRTLLSFAAAAALLGAGASLTAESNFPDLDIAQLLASSKEYRHRADVLRRMIGVRERKIGEIQQQANALIAQAQADAEARAQAAGAANGQNQAMGSVLGTLAGMIPGGNMMNNLTSTALSAAGTAVTNAGNQQVADAASQDAAQVGDAKGDADTLMAEASTFDAEKKKLAYKARQYEQLADAKDLLAAGEILRLEAERQSKAIADSDKEIEAERQFVKGMSLW
ncbi:MAG TPA: hypothetical protein VH309_04015 [Elusimicrobiota bacterium]|jgi:hypothetical protein|nr:hypothetical protein [Elusimicrobiota bacterium]